jgi:hypothetical protein
MRIGLRPVAGDQVVDDAVGGRRLREEEAGRDRGVGEAVEGAAAHQHAVVGERHADEVVAGDAVAADGRLVEPDQQHADAAGHQGEDRVRPRGAGAVVVGEVVVVDVDGAEVRAVVEERRLVDREQADGVARLTLFATSMRWLLEISSPLTLFSTRLRDTSTSSEVSTQMPLSSEPAA